MSDSEVILSLALPDSVTWPLILNSWPAETVVDKASSETNMALDEREAVPGEGSSR